MWTRELFGTDIYHLVASFVLYSILGWMVESFYMSICNRKLTNRGFAKGPFCPIYGFGAVAGYLLLSPLDGHYIKLYIVGAVLATVFEFIVGVAMIRFLGELWWDYNDKPFNYKGIICLESTIAWGFYAIGIIHFIHAGINRIIDRVSYHTGIRLVEAVLALVIVDYFVQLTKVFHIDVREKSRELYADVKDKSREVYTDVKDKSREVYTDVKDKSREVYADVKDKSREVYADVKDKSREVYADVKDKSREVYADVKDKSREVYADVKDKSREVYVDMREKRQEFVERCHAFIGRF